jgi:hypothetical protein
MPTSVRAGARYGRLGALRGAACGRKGQLWEDWELELWFWKGLIFREGHGYCVDHVGAVSHGELGQKVGGVVRSLAPSRSRPPTPSSRPRAQLSGAWSTLTLVPAQPPTLHYCCCPLCRW